MFSNRKQQLGKVIGRGGNSMEIEESFSALERARHFGTSKLSLQRLVFVNELVDTAHEIGYDATVGHLLPLVGRLADDSEVLVRQSLVGHFGDLAGFLIQSDPENGYQKVVDDVLPVVSQLLTEKASEVREGAAEALTTLASHLRPGERGDQVLMTVISMSHNNDDEDARATAVLLLNGLAEALGRDLCQQFVGVGLVALCEDPGFRVRKATAASFAEVAKVVGDEYALRRLLPAFAKLVHDGHWGVRKAAAENLVGLAMSLKVESRRDPFAPLMHALLKDNSRWVRMSSLQQLGYFVASLEEASRVPEGLLAQYVEIIEQTKANPDAADIGYHCAYTFAAVAKTVGPASWPMLQASFCTLCRDTQSKTRRAMAASAHIVAQALGPERVEADVLPEFEALLQDGALDVRQAALRNVAAILAALPSSPVAQRRILDLLQEAMGRAQAWRLRHLVASQLGAICDATAPAAAAAASGGASPKGAEEAAAGSEKSTEKEILWSVIVPLFLHLCTDSAAEVRDEAARATAKALRAAAPELFGPADEGSSGSSAADGVPPLSAPAQRLVRYFVRNFARGEGFRNRMVFVRMCDSIIREAPLPVFTELFMKPMVRLANDKVRNVRLLWATVVAPHVRTAGRLGANAVLVCAALRVMQAGSEKDESRRVLAAAPPATLSEAALAAGAAVLDEADNEDDGADADGEELWTGGASSEGGTGDSSAAGGGGVGGGSMKDGNDGKSPAERERAASIGQQPPPPPPPPAQHAGEQALGAADAGAARADGSAASESPFSAPVGDRHAVPPRPATLDSVGADDAHRTPATGSTSSPAGAGHPRKPPSPLMQAVPSPVGYSSEDRRTAFDPMEDMLVEQSEIDRDMDSAFRDRRLLHEAEEAAGLDSGVIDAIRSCGGSGGTSSDEGGDDGGGMPADTTVSASASFAPPPRLEATEVPPLPAAEGPLEAESAPAGTGTEAESAPEVAVQGKCQDEATQPASDTAAVEQDGAGSAGADASETGTSAE